MELRDGDYEKGGTVRAAAAVTGGVLLLVASSGFAIACVVCIVFSPTAAPGWAVASLLAGNYAVQAFAAA